MEEKYAFTGIVLFPLKFNGNIEKWVMNLQRHFNCFRCGNDYKIKLFGSVLRLTDVRLMAKSADHSFFLNEL